LHVAGNHLKRRVGIRAFKASKDEHWAGVNGIHLEVFTKNRRGFASGIA
jgi:basic membrane lipoprotein Med (substrate-binding protein (PBP1-ABC) superfamily)